VIGILAICSCQFRFDEWSLERRFQSVSQNVAHLDTNI
jgi:hypothetical protein